MNLTPLQIRMLEQMYNTGTYQSNWWFRLEKGDTDSSTYYPMERLINSLQIKKTDERNRAAKEFYDLIKQGFINNYRPGEGYYMTRKGVNAVKSLMRGDVGLLESELEKEMPNEGSRLERQIGGIAASVFILAGIFLSFSNPTILGDILFNSNAFQPKDMIAGALIMIGTFLFVFEFIIRGAFKRK